LSRGVTPHDAARRAHAAAAVAIGDFGPATCPTRDALSQWIDGRS
jgi:sugar/nucleoside kinase (ribokinase family)